jgi:hypothetical protein
VFSAYDITSVQISIDDVPLLSRVEHVEGPLHVCLWQPELYSTGLHRITVIARVSLLYKFILNQAISFLHTDSYC